MKRARASEGLYVDLDSMIEFARDGIVSKVVVRRAGNEMSLFCLSTGQELSAHTAGFPAIIHVLKGKGQIVLGSKPYEARPGAWFYLPKGLRHSVQSTDNLVFLLTLFKKQ